MRGLWFEKTKLNGEKRRPMKTIIKIHTTKTYTDTKHDIESTQFYTESHC